MDKKTILIGTLENKKKHSEYLKLFDIRTKHDLIDFKKSKIEHGFFHGNNITDAENILGVKNDESIVLMDDDYMNNHLQIFNQNFPNVDMLEELNKKNIKIEIIENPIELDLTGVKNIDISEGYASVFNSSPSDIDFLELLEKKSVNPTIDTSMLKLEDLESNDNQLPTLKEFKSTAKINKTNGKYKSLGESLNSLAKEYGYKEYRAIKPTLEKVESKKNIQKTKEQVTERCYEIDIYKYAKLLIKQLENAYESLSPEYNDFNDFYIDWTGNFAGIARKMNDIILQIIRLPKYSSLVKGIKEKYGFELNLELLIETTTEKEQIANSNVSDAHSISEAIEKYR